MVASESQTQQPANRRRFWRRRWPWMVGAGLGLVILLILAAPTIVTSRPVMRMVSAKVSALIGREIRIEWLHFGWVTPFHLERMEIPGTAGEANQPLLRVEGVRVPLTLWRAIRGVPYDLEGVRVEVFEATAVRRRNGTWNFDDVVNALGSGDPAEPKDPSAEAIILPLSRLGARIDGIAIRVIDQVEGVTAGWEGGRVEVLWQGGRQPLTLDAMGQFAIGSASAPWKLRAKVERFADAANTLTLDEAVLTASTGGMMHEGQISEGGLFIHAGPGLRDEQSIVRVVLPLESMAQLLRESELPGAELVPPAEGEIVLRVTGSPRDGIALWEFEGEVRGSGMRAQFEGYEDLPLVDTVWNLDGQIDLAENAFNDLALSGVLVGFETLVTVEKLRLDDISQPVGLAAETSLNLAEASQAVAMAYGAGADAPAPLEGMLSFTATATTLRPDEVAAEWTFALHPGMLAKTEPFMPWPSEQLGEPPLDLSPLAFGIHGVVSWDVASQMLEWEFKGTDSALASEVEGAGTYNGLTGSGNAHVRKVVELGALHDAFGDVLALSAGIESLDGRVVFESTSGIAESVTLNSQGQLLLEDFSLGMPGVGLALEQEQITLEWESTTHLPTAELQMERLTLNSEPIHAELSGKLSPEAIDLALGSQFDFDAIAARGFVPEGILIVGGAQMEMRAQGDPVELIDLELSVETDESFAFAQEGVLQFEGPAALMASTRLLVASVPQRFETLDITELSIGDTILGTLSVEWADDNTLTGIASLETALASMIGLFDPDFFAARGMDVLAEGDALMRSSFSGRMAHDEAAGWSAVGDWVFDSDLTMDIAYAEWAADWGSGFMEDAAVSHQSRMTVPMEEGGTIRLQDSGTISAAWMDGVAGLTMQDSTLDFSLVMDGSTFSMEIDRIATAGGVYAMDDMRLRIPSLAMSGGFVWNPESESMDLLFSVLEGGELLDGEVRGNFRASTQRWEASGDLGIRSLADFISLVETEDRLAYPPIAGGARVTFDMWGGVPSETEIASGHYPIGGSAEWDIAIDELDGGLDFQVGGLVSGGRVDFEEEEGRIAVSGRAVMREFANLALRSKPLRDIEAEFTIDMDGFSAIAWDLMDFRIGNYGTTARANGNIYDLNRALADTSREGLALWLQNAALDGRLRGEQDLSGFTGFMPMLVAGGVVDLSFDFRSAPGAALITGGLVDLRDVAVHWGEMFHLEGANGSWEFAKTLLLGTTARRPPPPPAGVITIDRMAFGLPPFMAELGETRATLRGLETPVTIDLTSRGFIGGTASANAVLRVLEGDPTLEVRLQATGLDIARIVLLGEQASTVRRDWEVSGVSLATWRLRDVAGDRALEDLNVSLQSTRIGKQAFGRMLQAMDPDETDPSIQQSRAALRLGTPTAARLNMRSGLISFDADLRVAAGLRTLHLPILNRQPIGDLLEVYQLQETMAVMPLVRWVILLMMAEDLETLERTLMRGGGNP